MIDETVGQRISRLRVERGLSLRAASSPGISHSFISRIENGTRSPSAKALRALARKLDVSAEYLERGNERTLTDDRLDELVASSSPVRVESSAETGVVVYWQTSTGTCTAHRATLTEALAEALAREREA